MKKIFLSFCFIFLIFQNLYSSDGTLDTATFNSPLGFNSTLTGNGIVATAIQTDGKIVAAGIDPTNTSYQIARYNTDGTLDLSVVGPVGLPTAIAIESDGNILVVGNNGTDIQVVRYSSVDLSIIQTFTLISGVGQTIAIQTDGKILVAGSNIGPAQFLVARFNVDGTPDVTFGPGGIATGPNPAGGAGDLVLQADEKIVVVGSDISGNFVVARYNQNGTLDDTFGSGAGFVITPAGAALAVNIQPDGYIIVGGLISILGVQRPRVVRYTPTGDLDMTFATGGIYTDTTFDARVTELNLQADGKIIAYARTNAVASQTFILFRLTDAGILDATFGTAGYVTLPGGPFNQSLSQTGALQEDGKIIAAGINVMTALDFKFMIARYINSVPLTPTTITFPANNQTVDFSTLTFEGTAQNPSNVYLFLNGVLLGGVVTDPSGSNTWEFATAGLQPGTYTLLAVSIYKDGNVNIDSELITFTINPATPPIPPVPVLPTCASTIVNAIISKYCPVRFS